MALFFVRFDSLNIRHFPEKVNKSERHWHNPLRIEAFREKHSAFERFFGLFWLKNPEIIKKYRSDSFKKMG